MEVHSEKRGSQRGCIGDVLPNKVQDHHLSSRTTIGIETNLQIGLHTAHEGQNQKYRYRRSPNSHVPCCCRGKTKLSYDGTGSGFVALNGLQVIPNCKHGGNFIFKSICSSIFPFEEPKGHEIMEESLQQELWFEIKRCSNHLFQSC